MTPKPVPSSPGDRIHDTRSQLERDIIAKHPADQAAVSALEKLRALSEELDANPPPNPYIQEVHVLLKRITAILDASETKPTSTPTEPK